MESFRAALDEAGRLPAPQAETALRDLLKTHSPLPPMEEGNLRYALALSLLHQHKNEEARDMLEKAVQLLTGSGTGLALAMTALARIELICNDREKSLATGRKALALLKKHLSPNDTRMAPSLFSLSFAEYESRQLDRAEQLCLEAKKLWESQRGPESLEVSTCLNNLGRIYEEMGREEEGIAHHKAALAIRRKVLGDNPETAFSMGNLGTALASAGKWEEAAEMLEEAIACYARCGHASGNDIDGYRRNLNICRQALADQRA